MAIPQNLVDEIMVKCGRHCCICRRFAPLHLQVHHIVESGEGGTDDPDNLIAVCLTCHSDAHAETRLTRRFTVSELKMDREAVFKAVHEGRSVGRRQKEEAMLATL
jgi:5-methylcytosine-specific restriction endonuclease McrA